MPTLYDRYRPLGTKGLHCFLLNEVHGLSSKVVSRMQTVVELPQVQANSLWILTTTLAGQKHLFDTRFDALPFLSRAAKIELGIDLDAFAKRAQEIAQAENLDGQPLSAYLKLARDCNGNLREMLSRIACGEMCL